MYFFDVTQEQEIADVFSEKVLNPDENIKKQIELSNKILNSVENGKLVPKDDLVELSFLVNSLDNWLSTNGYLPERWGNRNKR